MVNGAKDIRINRINGHSHPALAVKGPVGQGEVDLQAIEGAVRTILRAVGEDPDRPGLLDTHVEWPACTRRCLQGCIGTRRGT